MSEPTPDAHPRDRLKRELGLTDATLLVVSGVVGSGIFLTPGRIAELLPHVGWIFAAWLAGGLLSLAGALANAELGAMYPRAGGDYVYLREAFHPLAGFLVGWLSFFVIYAGTIATLAAGLAAGLAEFLPGLAGSQVAIAVALTWAVSALNYAGVRWGALANNLTAALKIGALLAFVLLGPVFGAGSFTNLTATAPSGGLSVSAFSLALSPVLFSYLGWNSSVYVASEIRDPSRNLPWSLFLGVAICTALYLLINAVYLFAIPVGGLAGQANAGEAAARALFGGLGGTLVAAFVLASILGTLNATILVGPRIAYAMALDGLFFRGVDRAHPAYRTPSMAIWVQAAIASGILLALETFERALDYTTFAIVLATMADVAALYRLRRRKPDRPRPYRAWGYPWVPALYLLANGAVAAALLGGRPVECAIGLGLVALGLPFYWAFTRKA
ncbi:MAG: amino acid permease [Myxococcota bacterium]|nr:amino acid permease [Myxococcota bacterium]